MNTITNKIIKRIRGKRRGWVFTPKDFLDIGFRAAVDKVLSRLTAKGLIRRLDRGIYDFPKQHKILGTLSPDMTSLAKAVAKSGDIASSGAMSANMLGLSTQVPAKQVYLTNGKSHSRNIGGRLVVLKHARVGLFNNAPPTVNLAVQALFYMGKDNIDDAVIRKCARVLKPNDKNALVARAGQLPNWLADVVHRIEQLENHR